MELEGGKRTALTSYIATSFLRNSEVSSIYDFYMKEINTFKVCVRILLYKERMFSSSKGILQDPLYICKHFKRIPARSVLTIILPLEVWGTKYHTPMVNQVPMRK